MLIFIIAAVLILLLVTWGEWRMERAQVEHERRVRDILGR